MSDPWFEDAKLFTAALGATNQQFTVDEVWEMLNQHSTHDAGAARALGAVVKQMSSPQHGVIAPLAAWQPSVRAKDRALRLFIGTGKVSEAYVPANKHILWALKAINAVAQQRAIQMSNSIARARGMEASHAVV